MKFIISTSITALTLALASCGGSDNSNDDTSTTTTTPVTTTNTAPVVETGDNQTVGFGESVSINATTSDADGDNLTYTWTTDSSSISLDSPNTEDTSFTAPSQAEVITLTLSTSDGTDTTTDSVTITVEGGTDTSTGNEKIDSWIINTTGTLDSVTEDDGITGATFQVQSVAKATVNSEEFIVVNTDGLPHYEVIFTQEMKDELESRPRHTTVDFPNGISVEVGDKIKFGDDIGFNTSADQDFCESNGGVGYWPPGPDCAGPQEAEVFFPVEPLLLEDDTSCEQGLGTLGLYVNSASIFGWGDGMSSGDFTNLAAEQEVYDLDVCSGHSAMGEYHNHNYSQCLADLVGDVGDDHSPIYGFASDGFPIYGPYEGDGVLAVSGWALRDYSASPESGGCNTTTERSCILIDEYNINGGVTTDIDPGPDFDDATYTTLSGNPLIPINGVFYEDYVYTQATVTGPQLDKIMVMIQMTEEVITII